MIDNCREGNVESCSVILRLGKLFKIKTTGTVDPPKNMPVPEEIELPYVLNPGEYVLASTIEKMHQTKTKYAVIIAPLSKTFRIGLGIQAGMVHPTYKGELIFGIKNLAEHKIRLRRGMDLVHLCFFDVKSDIIPLHRGYQHGRVI
ncbi:hypothetical protein KY359_05045 [Candidatus Woesearchaeota archaeon]|nr:hypothetical protein [Candidatus Woesearchaeota archaeon]